MNLNPFINLKFNMALIDLLEKVRVRGRVKIKRDLPIEESLPIAITRDSGNIQYLNSGGRNIIFQFNDRSYKMKGVDPYGLLTKKVSKSKKNKLIDVAVFDNLEKLRKRSNLPPIQRDKPFGVLLKEDAVREKEAFEILNEKYNQFGINPPCRYYGTYEFRNGYVQNLYELPSLDSDFRLEEFDQLLRDRLNRCDANELEKKVRQISKLYARFLRLVGWNIGLCAKCGLEPSSNSWMPQNFVISKFKDGYGVFRVDHTSTKVNEKYDAKALSDKILAEASLGNLEDPTFGSYVHIPTSILIALNFKLSTGAEPSKKEPLFEQGYNYLGDLYSWKGGYDSFMKVFGMAFVSGFSHYGEPEPIQESMLREALM